MSGLFFLLRQSAKLRYLLQSGFVFTLNLGVTVAAHEWLGLPKNLAFALALVTVIATGFLSLKYFVYQATSGPIVREFLAYLPSVGMFAVLQYILFWGLGSVAGVDYRLANIAAQGTTFVLKFFFYQAFVFQAAKAGSAPETQQGNG